MVSFGWTEENKISPWTGKAADQDLDDSRPHCKRFCTEALKGKGKKY